MRDPWLPTSIDIDTKLKRGISVSFVPNDLQSNEKGEKSKRWKIVTEPKEGRLQVYLWRAEC
jgi:hypothetical protein